MFNTVNVMSKRNPAWVRDELILTLDLYTRYNPSRISKTHPEVIALSKILKKLPLHRHRPDRKRFRNPNSVYMTLRTFMSLDPLCKATGLTHVNKLEKTVWKEFSRDLKILNDVAVAIKSLANSPVIKSLITPDEEESEVSEGKLLFRLHKKHETNRKLVQQKKKRTRSLKCEMCSFDFEAKYGPLGRGYIEIHHNIPLSKLNPSRKTRLSDLILVCPNCHCMLHRLKPDMTVKEFKNQA